MTEILICPRAPSDSKWHFIKKEGKAGPSSPPDLSFGGRRLFYGNRSTGQSGRCGKCGLGGRRGAPWLTGSWPEGVAPGSPSRAAAESLRAARRQEVPGNVRVSRTQSVHIRQLSKATCPGPRGKPARPSRLAAGGGGSGPRGPSDMAGWKQVPGFRSRAAGSEAQLHCLMATCSAQTSPHGRQRHGLLSLSFPAPACHPRCPGLSKHQGLSNE